MRVISMKNYCAESRIIIQLMQYHNKVSHLLLHSDVIPLSFCRRIF